MSVIRNATITKLSLGPEDHGILTCYLGLDYGDGMHQSFGGYNIRTNAGWWIENLLETFGINEWNKLMGKNIRVRLDDDTLNGRIIEIGHIINDKWFNPKSYTP